MSWTDLDTPPPVQEELPEHCRRDGRVVAEVPQAVSSRAVHLPCPQKGVSGSEEETKTMGQEFKKYLEGRGTSLRNLLDSLGLRRQGSGNTGIKKNSKIVPTFRNG